MGDLNDILDVLKNMATILAGVFYISIVLWTYKDARKRIDDPILVATSTAVAMLPIVGVFVYMLLRPSEYLADVRERELEIRMMERQLGRQERCPYCKSHIEGEFLSCPVCTTKLRQCCNGCDKPLDPRWVMCPFCEIEVPGRGRPAPTPGDAPRQARKPAPRREESAPARSSSPARERRSTMPSATKPSSSKPSASKPSASKPSASKATDSKPSSSSKATSPSKKDADITTEPFGPGDRSPSDTLI